MKSAFDYRDSDDPGFFINLKIANDGFLSVISTHSLRGISA